MFCDSLEIGQMQFLVFYFCNASYEVCYCAGVVEASIKAPYLKVSTG